ncbi:UNVERIFIED_CONTAM: hypothetical protein FKN15_021596 [Acipenser sinensis]
MTLEDQGMYVCQVITFPSGNFETTIDLTLLISSLDPASPPLVEGSAVAVAAVCTSWGVVPPTVAWETGLEGSNQLNQAAGGKVTNKFWVKPNRVMNGEKLDCLITHQSLKEPRRIPYTIVVHYPPDVSLTGYENDWFVGMEGGALKCMGKGNPEPNHFTWTRTLEFLMRHLIRMASFSRETNMHARNLAIVWAPNLLRSKDIESGFNGTAAFMEVRIQSIVVEFILMHVEQLFNDASGGESSV